MATAIQNPNLTAEDAKALLRQLSGKVVELEDRLADFEDTEQQVAVEELPQTHTEQKQLWSNMCTAFPSFIDSVLTNQPSLHTPQFLQMSNEVQTKMIDNL